ncbi:MAG: hypothetical protein WC492_00815 [Candidatus Micrarchaeia archaeon]
MKKAHINYKKGFFFTVLALVLLSFIFISVQIWAQAKQVEENRAAEQFRLSAMRTSLKLISNETLSNYAKASMLYALNKLSSSIEEHPDLAVKGIKFNDDIKKDPEGIKYVNASIYELMIYGNTSGYLVKDYSSSSTPATDYFYNYVGFDPDLESGGSILIRKNLTYSGEEKKYAISYFFESTTQAAKMLGYNIAWGKPYNFSFNQSDLWHVRVYMQVPVEFSDLEGRLKINKELSADATIDIQGLSDPYIMRKDVSYRDTPFSIDSTFFQSRPHRNVYHITGYEDYRTGGVQAQLKKEGLEGMGWFYGPVAENIAHDDALFASKQDYRYNISKLNQYIFATSDADLARAESAFFGGIILYGQSSFYSLTNRVEVQSKNPNLPCYRDEYSQTGCLWCVKKYEYMPPQCSDTSLPEPYYYKYPARLDIPHVVVSGGLPSVQNNYHLQMPYMLIDNKLNISDICGAYNSDPSCRNLGTTVDESLALLQRKQSDSSGGNDHSCSIWDMNGPRDMALCGYYTWSPYGPSYLQRLSAIPSSVERDRTDTAKGIYPGISTLGFGIESFDVGTWAGGKIDQNTNKNLGAADSEMELSSRVDYQFYRQSGATPACMGMFQKSMPGCKDSATCSNQTMAIEYSTGRFAFTIQYDNPVERYNMTKLGYVPLGSGFGVSSCK